MQPRYLAIEGADGAGKSTQLKLLVKAFQQAEIPLQTTREPGGFPVGEEIRKILLTGSDEKLSSITEALLFSANRCELMHQLVKPELARGHWVISDRTFLTTLVFQGCGRGLDVAMLKTLTDIALGDFRPALQLILDVPAEIGLGRKTPLFEEGLDESRFESIGLAFHQRNRAGYAAYAQENPTTTALIDATPAIPVVHRAILTELNTRFGLSLQPQA